VRAASLFRKSCELGVAASCGMLADMYQIADGIASDSDRMMKYARKGCDLGDDVACTTLGLALSMGWSDKSDAAQGAKLLTVPCERGDGRACAGLAQLYRDGNGVSQSRDKAVQLFDVACAKKARRASVQFAVMLCDLADPAPDADCRPAVAPLRVACFEQNEKAPCFMLGLTVAAAGPRVVPNSTLAARCGVGLDEAVLLPA
jgi:TPR repeat protein